MQAPILSIGAQPPELFRLRFRAPEVRGETNHQSIRHCARMLGRRHFLAPLRGAGPFLPFNQGLPGYASLHRLPLANFLQPLAGQSDKG